MSRQKQPLDPFFVTLLATCFVVGLLGVYFGGQMYQKNEKSPSSTAEKIQITEDAADLNEAQDTEEPEISASIAENLFEYEDPDGFAEEVVRENEPEGVQETETLTLDDVKDMDSALEFSGPMDMDLPQPEVPENDIVENEAPEIIASLPKIETPEVLPSHTPSKMQTLILPDFKDDRPRVVIIIDDLGIDVSRSAKMVELPGPLTLAFLPYAKNLKEKTARALENGHELLIHVPMEPMNEKLDPGPLALRTGMEDKDFGEMLETILKSFDGYVGINNHMGSRLTQDQKAMDVVMARLKQDDLIFVDSITINTSVAAKTARAHQISYAERDVFLDHVPEKDFVVKALKKLERRAKENGYAIAIGHPKDVTIEALEEWLPTLEEKGFVLVPVSKVLKKSAGEIADESKDEASEGSTL